MVSNIFISYAKEDISVADTICANLENRGLRCWIAPRDIAPGEKYATAIIHAIENAKVVVVVFSRSSDQSAHVRTEIERAFNQGKIIIPFRIENIEPSDETQYFIGSRQWLDAFSGSLEGHTIRLADIIERYLTGDPEFRETHEKPSSGSKQLKTISEGDFPKKIAPGKLFQIIRRFCSYSVDLVIGLFLGFFYSLSYNVLASARIGQENFNLLTYVSGSNNQIYSTYGNHVLGILWISGIIFWFLIIDISGTRSPGKALFGLKIYWPSDKTNSDKWRTIRSLIKNGPLLTYLILIFIGYNNTVVIGLAFTLTLVLYVIWMILIIFTPKSQSVHDLIAGTFVG